MIDTKGVPSPEWHMVSLRNELFLATGLPWQKSELVIFLPRVVLGQNVKVKINPSTSDHKAQKLGKVHASSTPCKGRGFQEANECRKVTRKCSEGTFPSRCGGNPPGVWGGRGEGRAPRRRWGKVGPADYPSPRIRISQVCGDAPRPFNGLSEGEALKSAEEHLHKGRGLG